MKTYGVNTPERWERIAESIPNRSKKDCMKRYKVSLPVPRSKWSSMFSEICNLELLNADVHNFEFKKTVRAVYLVMSAGQ